MTVGTDLYWRVIEYEGPHQDLTREVWAPTPWMIDVFTDGTASKRDCRIRHWCREHFGPEAWPIHGYEGCWQRGGATINGWTWFGFATRELMEQFLAAWPQPDTGEAA